MPFPTAPAANPIETASGDEAINSLLGADLGVTETEAPVTEDTSVADRGTEVEEEPESGVEDTTEEPTEEGEPTEESSEEEQGEEESGEEEFDVSDLETDFAESAYAKAAEHYSKQFNKQLDPNDPGDRALLRELMERGRKISELQSREEPEEEEEEGTEEAPEAKEAPAPKTPEEVITAQLESARNYSKTNINPIVLKDAILPMMGAMANFFWGKEKGAAFMANRRPEDLLEMAQAMDTVMTLKGMEIASGILPNVGKAVETAYPFFSKSQDLAEKEAAVEEILSDKLYTGFDKLVDTGAINRALASPELKDAVFSKDPYKNRVAKLKMAFKLARNERVDPKMLAEASRRGREAEKTRSLKVAAGRTPPGSSSRGAAGAPRGRLIDQIVANGSSRAARLFRDVGRSKQ
jgi:hypothetical protein